MARWLTTLQTYDMTVEHRPGRKHGNADALSRCQHGCRDADDLTFQPGSRASLAELTTRAKLDFPEVTPPKQLPKVLTLDRDHCPGPPFAGIARPVMTRRRRKLEKEELALEEGLGLADLFSQATKSELSGGAKPKDVRPKGKARGRPLKAPETRPSDDTDAGRANERTETQEKPVEDFSGYNFSGILEHQRIREFLRRNQYCSNHFDCKNRRIGAYGHPNAIGTHHLVLR